MAMVIKWNQAADHLFLPNIKLFQKTKSGLELIPCLIFWIVFKEKYLSWDILLTDQISLYGCL